MFCCSSQKNVSLSLDLLPGLDFHDLSISLFHISHFSVILVDCNEPKYYAVLLSTNLPELIVELCYSNQDLLWISSWLDLCIYDISPIKWRSYAPKSMLMIKPVSLCSTAPPTQL